MQDKLKDLIKSIVEEIMDEDKELEEITVTGDVDGYNIPSAFTGKKGKKKKKEFSTNSTGYKTVNEALEREDIKTIKALIRDVVADILRDIWIKRSVWKKA